MPNEITDFTAEKSGSTNGETDPPNVELDDTGKRENSGDEEQGVAREEEADEKPRFGENNNGHA